MSTNCVYTCFILATGSIHENEASVLKFMNQWLIQSQMVFRVCENLFHGIIHILTCPSPPPKKGSVFFRGWAQTEWKNGEVVSTVVMTCQIAVIDSLPRVI